MIRSVRTFSLALAALAAAGGATAKEADGDARRAARPGETVVVISNGKLAYLPRWVVERDRERQLAGRDAAPARAEPRKVVGHALAVQNGRIVHVPRYAPEALAAAD